jgi:hypothetical protein
VVGDLASPVVRMSMEPTNDHLHIEGPCLKANATTQNGGPEGATYIVTTADVGSENVENSIDKSEGILCSNKLRSISDDKV